MSAATAVTSALGVGLLGLLGYFLRALRADIGRLDGRIDRLEVAHREEMTAIRTAHREEMTAIRTAHREEMTAIREEIQGIHVTLGEIKEILASHTATLAAHSLQLQRVMDQGERVAALEGALSKAS